MSCMNVDKKGLSKRERELTAIGAAIASNCVPCIEYHIPQAGRVGMSDSEIREAVELADKIRRVPADKVTKTALAHLEDEAGTGANQERVRLDNRGANEDNETESKGCGDKSGDAANNCGHDEAAGGQQSAANQTGFDFSKMMEKMKHCCPDNMKDLSSKMTGFDGGCCPSEEETGSKESV